MRPNPVLLAALIAALLAASAWSQPGPPADAPPAPQQVRAADAEWLRANPRDPSWPEAFRAFLGQTPQLDRVRAIFESLVELPHHLGPDLALEIGGLLEVAGSLEAALRYYERAALTAPSPAAQTGALLAAAAVACDLGANDQALALLDRALSAAPEEPLRAQLTVMRAVLLHDKAPTQATQRALTAATTAAPPGSQARLHGLLALADYARTAGQTAERDARLEQIEREYPGSPEAALLSGPGPVSRALSPRQLLRTAAAADPPRPPSPAAAAAPLPAAPEASPLMRVQTGSFTVSENATFMARDLKAAGFETAVERVELAGKAYYRVLLAGRFSQEDARSMLIRLKDKGFEGVILP